MWFLNCIAKIAYFLLLVLQLVVFFLTAILFHIIICKTYDNMLITHSYHKNEAQVE